MKSPVLLSFLAASLLFPMHASAALIIGSGFEEPALDSSSFTPGVNDSELGFAAVENNPQNSKLNEVVNTTFRSGSQSFFSGHDGGGTNGSNISTITFDAVDLSLYKDVSFSLYFNMATTQAYEASDTLSIDLVLTGTSNINVFSGSGSTLDNLMAQWNLASTSIPDAADSAQLVITTESFNFGGEGVYIDDVAFEGTMIPEPGVANLMLLSLLGITLRRRTR